MPALFTMMSSAPSWLTAVETARSTSAARLVSAWTPSALPPAPMTTATLSCKSTVTPSPSVPLTLPSPQRGEGNEEGTLSSCEVRVPGSYGQGVAVATGVGARHEGARFRIAREPLSAAHHPRPVVDDIDLMPAPAELGARPLGDARLGVYQAVPIGADTWRLDGLLEVQPELQEVEQHLRLGLEDAVGAGRADAEREGAVLEDLGGRHHRARLAARLQHIGRGGIAVRPFEDIVQEEAGARHRETRAEDHAERLGDGDHGALRVRAGEVGGLLVHELRRVALGDLAGQPLPVVPLALAHRRPRRIDARALRGRIGLRREPRDRWIPRVGVGQPVRGAELDR